MNTHGIIITVLIIVVIIGGGYFLFSKDESQEPAMTTEETVDEQEEAGEVDSEGDGENTTQAPEDNGMAVDEEGFIIVTYTDNGYEPNTVTIKKGETVQFVNESSRGMWTATDNHPTHTLYPQSSAGDCLGSTFDSCTATQPGDSWEFTFDVAGEWGYHNHVHANRTGTVIVVE